MPSVYGQRQKDNNFTMDGVEFHGKVSFLKAGIAHADALNTLIPCALASGLP